MGGLGEPETPSPVIERACQSCGWASAGGRCQNALAPQYAALIAGKLACDLFVQRYISATKGGSE